MPWRPCLGTLGVACTSLAPPGQPRCPVCTRLVDRQRGSRQQRGYDIDYERARAALHLEARPPCRWCGAPATTADHDPPIAEAGRHTNLVPACVICNYGHRSAHHQPPA